MACRPRKVSHPLWNLVEDRWWSVGTSARLDSWKCVFVKDSWIKPHTRLSWKKTCFLLLWQCSPTLRIVFSSRTMRRVTQSGQSRCGWRTTRSKTLSCPAQSPDLNPIENLWNVTKRKMYRHKPSNKAELLEFLHQEWHKVPQHQCERLVESMPRRMKAVTDNQGYSTKCWFLNSS